MMPVRISAFILFSLAAVRGAPGPFGDSENAGQPPKQVDAQAVICVDWIRLPKPAAGKLLREKLKSIADGPALHAALETLIAAGRATRKDFSMFTVPDGDRTKIESLREDPAVTIWSTRTADDGGMELQPDYIQWTNLGLTMEIEATIAPDLSFVDLTWFSERRESIAPQRFGSGRCEFVYPVQHDDRSCYQQILPAGEWRLTGCWDVPVPPAEGFTDSISPAYPDVILKLVRAGIQSLRPAREPVPPPKECLLISEWIEAPAALAAEFCAGFSTEDAIRDVLAANRADLRAITVLPVRDHQRAKCEGITNPGDPVETNQDEQHRKLQTLPVAINILNGGRTVEAEADFLPLRNMWEVRVATESILLEGTIPVTPHGQEALSARAVKAVTCTSHSTHLIQPGQTLLASMSDASPVDTTSGDPSRRRVLMHFVRVLP